MENGHPNTRFLNNHGTHLAYQVFGEGPVLCLVNGFLSHLEVFWEQPDFADFFSRLSEHFTVIIYDKRGIGLSDRTVDNLTLDAHQNDLLALFEAENIDSALLLGVSEGGPLAVQFAATYPKRVKQLVLYGTMPKWLRSFDYPWAMNQQQYEQWLTDLTQGWGESTTLHTFAPSRAEDPELQQWWAKFLRYAASPQTMATVLSGMSQVDIRQVLGYVKSSCLVIHRRDDKAVPIAGGRQLVAHVEGARFLELAGSDHLWWLGDSDSVLRAIIEFGQGECIDGTAVQPVLTASLTRRDHQLLTLMAAGYTNQQMADELFLSIATVKTYTSQLYRKLGAKNRSEAVHRAKQLALLDRSL